MELVVKRRRAAAVGNNKQQTLKVSARERVFEEKTRQQPYSYHSFFFSDGKDPSLYPYCAL